MPRQGILPHDLIHYVVESTLGYRHGFLGEVASGADIAFAMQMSHDLAHTAPSPELSQAEAIVESLQAQLWSGAFDQAMFDEGLRSACAMHDCVLPPLADAHGRQLYDAVIALGQRWQQVPFHASMTLTCCSFNWQKFIAPLRCAPLQSRKTRRHMRRQKKF